MSRAAFGIGYQTRESENVLILILRMKLLEGLTKMTSWVRHVEEVVEKRIVRILRHLLASLCVEI